MNISGYGYSDAKANHTHAYLWSPVENALRNQCSSATNCSVFDLGCGSGAFAAYLFEKGFKVQGVDPSTSGVENARREYPHLNLQIGSSQEDLAARFGQFDALTSLEVVEHVFLPREFVHCAFNLIKPGGMAIFSTPYHGYLKNLALAITGKMDAHFTALWDYGHIKFWSIRTLSILLKEAGFERLQFIRVGRIPLLAKSMIVIAQKPK